jgi:hypothetical protein
MLNETNDVRIARLEEQVKANSEKVQIALAASEKAIMKAETATEKRFEAVNEFRQTLSDQAANFVTRELHDQLEKDIQAIRNAQSRMIGVAAGISTAITIIGVLLSIVLRLTTA